MVVLCGPSPSGHIVRIYKDNFGQHRLVLSLYGSEYKDQSGLAALFLMPCGTIKYKCTAEHARGNNYTRQLALVAALHGIPVRASQWQTEAGKACYKNT